MIRYAIYCKEIQIGILEIQNGLYRYTPDFENVEKVKYEIHLIHEMLQKSDWRKPIPFFEERIYNASRFGTEDNIKYHTDPFRMIMIKEP